MKYEYWNFFFFFRNCFLNLFNHSKRVESCKHNEYLNPIMGYSLHILHFAWCFALSAAESLWSTGNQTILCGSCCSQLKKWTASISFLSFPAFSKQLRTLGSMFDPPNAATSPNCLGTWMQSCNNKPSFRWSTNLFGSAISRNRSGISLTLHLSAFRKKIWQIEFRKYSHRYFSSKWPLHNRTKPTLKESTRIWPVRWLKYDNDNLLINDFDYYFVKRILEQHYDLFNYE